MMPSLYYDTTQVYNGSAWTRDAFRTFRFGDGAKLSEEDYAWLTDNAERLKDITKLFLEGTITEISEEDGAYITTARTYAFYSCSSLTDVSLPNCSYIGNQAFCNCTSLTSVSLPMCSYIGSSAFYYCTSLSTVSLPVCTGIGNYALYNCTNLSTISLPMCSSIGGNAFRNCLSLTSVSLPMCSYIGDYAFDYCSSLSTIYIGSSSCSLAGSTAFYGTGITSSTGRIYVPVSLFTYYKASTNWTYFSSRIYAYYDRDNNSGGVN